MSDEYEVEEIIGKRLNQKGQTQYLIKWQGYSLKESTWEPAENLQKIKPMIRVYEENSKKKTNEESLPNKQSEETNKRVGGYHEILDSLGPLVPSVIITAKPIENILHCLVNFVQTEEEKFPPAYIPSSVLKDTYPKILIDYYETRIRFVPIVSKNKI